jgi:hypothetical protein
VRRNYWFRCRFPHPQRVMIKVALKAAGNQPRD